MDTTISIDEVLAAAGGAKQVHRGLVDFTRRAMLLSGMMPDLRRGHPDEWVALLEGDELVFAKSRDDLMGKVRLTGKPADSAVVKFLDTNPVKMIL